MRREMERRRRRKKWIYNDLPRGYRAVAILMVITRRNGAVTGSHFSGAPWREYLTTDWCFNQSLNNLVFERCCNNYRLATLTIIDVYHGMYRVKSLTGTINGRKSSELIRSCNEKEGKKRGVYKLVMTMLMIFYFDEFYNDSRDNRVLSFLFLLKLKLIFHWITSGYYGICERRVGKKVHL